MHESGDERDEIGDEADALAMGRPKRSGGSTAETCRGEKARGTWIDGFRALRATGAVPEPRPKRGIELCEFARDGQKTKRIVSAFIRCAALLVNN